MFTVYRWDASGDCWVAVRSFAALQVANRYAMALETRGTAVRCIVRRGRSA